MRYTRPQITTVAGTEIVEAIGPASAVTSGARLPRDGVVTLGVSGDRGEASR